MHWRPKIVGNFDETTGLWMYPCSICKHILPESAYYSSHATEGRYSMCKRCFQSRYKDKVKQRKD